MSSHFFLLAIYFAPALGLIPEDCPLNLPRDNFLKTLDNKCYRFEVTDPQNFKDAQKFCQEGGGNLAVISSKQINDFLQDKFLNDRKEDYNYHGRVWIGAHYAFLHIKFAWVDNSRDNVVEEKQDGVDVGTTGSKWGDMEFPFICEYLPVFRKSMTPPSPPPTTQSPRTTMVHRCPVSGINQENIHVFRGMCYYFDFEKEKTFEDAHQFCRSFGGNLALVKTKEINKFLVDRLQITYNMTSKLDKDIVWIGLKYDPVFYAFRWVDGSPLNYSNSESPISSHKCMGIIPSNGKWRSDSCLKAKSKSWDPRNHFICEFKSTLTSIPAPTTTHLPWTTMEYRCPVAGIAKNNVQLFGDTCYYFDFGNEEFFEGAQQFCKTFGGHLATIKSQEINDFIVDRLNNEHNLNSNASSDLVWIGLRYDPVYYAFRWVDGTPLVYSNSETPIATHECMAIIPETGKWRSETCLKAKSSSWDPRNHFICQFKATWTVVELYSTPTPRTA